MQSNLYLHLYHGRKDPQEDLEDRGSAGPIFGPYESIQITYEAHIKMHAPDRFDDLTWQDDLVFMKVSRSLMSLISRCIQTQASTILPGRRIWSFTMASTMAMSKSALLPQHQK